MLPSFSFVPMYVHCADASKSLTSTSPIQENDGSAQCTSLIQLQKMVQSAHSTSVLSGTHRWTALNNTYFVCIPLIRTYNTYIIYIVKIRGCQKSILFVALFYI